MNPHRPQPGAEPTTRPTRRGRRWTLAAIAALTLLATAACSGSTPGTTSPAAAAPDTPITHIHAVARDRQTGTLLLATHQGLFRLEAGTLQTHGPVIDLMSFSVGPDGTYYASGHPGPRTDLPQPVGLITSDDAGRTWTVASRGGQSDFHALAITPTAVVGYDGDLWVSQDHRTWAQQHIPSPPRNLAAAPESGTLLATTAAGLLTSRDNGATWNTLTPPQLLTTVTWADEKTIVGATTSGQLATSTDAGATWTLGSNPVGQVQSIWAGPHGAGQVEILAVIGDTVLRTLNAGDTTQTLIS